MEKGLVGKGRWALPFPFPVDCACVLKGSRDSISAFASAIALQARGRRPRPAPSRGQRPGWRVPPHPASSRHPAQSRYEGVARCRFDPHTQHLLRTFSAYSSRLRIS